MTAPHFHDEIDAWSPEEQDLRDEIALHLDACAACRARFDARFRPADLPADAAPAGLLARTAPPRRRRRVLPLLAGLLPLAAAAMGAVYLVDRSTKRFEDAAVAVSDPAASSPHRGPTPPPERTLLPGLGYTAPAEDDGELKTLGYFETTEPGGPPKETDARDHRLSTFSMDVDTASYTYARRTLRDGHLPIPSEIRVEEFVNYFAYDYRLPVGAPFAASVESAPSPFSPGRTLVRVGLQARVVQDRRPVHLTFLVDTSGSMQGPDRLGLVKQSLQMLVGALRDGDTVAIVAYAGSAGIILEPTPATDPAPILASLDRLQAGGSTAMGAGLDLAYKLAELELSPGSESRVIVASDGDANVGRTNGVDLAQLIRSKADRGITLTTLGFGAGNYRDATMESLADKGDGNYYYIDSELEARRVVVDRLTSTVATVARDAKIQVEWDPSAVLTWKLLGYEDRAIADRDFRNDAVDAGEVGSGHQVTALYEVALAPGHPSRLGTLRLRSEAPGARSPASEQDLPLEAALDDSFAQSTPDFRRAAVAAAFALQLRGEGPGWPWLAENAPKAANRESPADAELVDLVARARAIARSP